MHRRTRSTAVMSAALLALAGLSMSTAGPTHAAAGCDVTYEAYSWNTGFTSNIAVKNLGAATSSWTLEFDFPGNQQVSQGWSGTYSQSGHHVRVTNAAWNGSLATNGSTQIGFNGTYSGTNAKPTSFTVNGVTCRGVIDPTWPPPTTPPPTTPPPTTPTSHHRRRRRRRLPPRRESPRACGCSATRSSPRRASRTGCSA